VSILFHFFFFQAEDGIRDYKVTGVQTCALPIWIVLDHQREDLNPQVPRVMCVLRPLKLVIENYPEGMVEELEAPYYPHDVPKQGSRKVPFSRVLHIERDDFAEQPPKGFHRLSPGREVRLRYAYLVRCESVV